MCWPRTSPSSPLLNLLLSLIFCLVIRLAEMLLLFLELKLDELELKLEVELMELWLGLRLRFLLTPPRLLLLIKAEAEARQRRLLKAELNRSAPKATSKQNPILEQKVALVRQSLLRPNKMSSSYKKGRKQGSHQLN